MSSMTKRIIKRLPPFRSLARELDRLRTEHRIGGRFVPPGHYFSPIPDPEEVRRNDAYIFAPPPSGIPSVDLRIRQQLELLEVFKGYYHELPFPERPDGRSRYHLDNNAYTYSDAVILYCMIRHLRPRRIIEVGSGYSSCAILDTDERFFGNSIACTFIEPYPDLLYRLIREEDRLRMRIISSPLQEVDTAVFESLEENDILFIDSTHVSRVGSDVNHIFFRIMPALQVGVFIHFHDVFYPFEYPKEWIYEGRAWNEAYLLHGFLQYNHCFRIEFFNTYLEHFFPERFARDMPLCLKNTGGSIWLQKVADWPGLEDVRIGSTAANKSDRCDSQSARRGKR